MTAALAATFALTLAGVITWLHGFSRGERHNDLLLAHAGRRIGQLRGEVAILRAGMVTEHDLDREGADLDRGAS